MSETPGALFPYLNFLRTSELLGVHYLLRMARVVRDPAILAAIHRHLAEEANHARLWADTISGLGGAISPQPAFQAFMSEDVPSPRGVVDVLALNVVTERRAMRLYQLHASREGNLPRVQRVLEHLIREEQWHIEWQEEWLEELAGSRGRTMEEALARYKDYDVRATRRAFQAFGEELFTADEREVICSPGDETG